MLKAPLPDGQAQPVGHGPSLLGGKVCVDFGDGLGEGFVRVQQGRAHAGPLAAVARKNKDSFAPGAGHVALVDAERVGGDGLPVAGEGGQSLDHGGFVGGRDDKPAVQLFAPPGHVGGHLGHGQGGVLVQEAGVGFG